MLMRFEWARAICFHFVLSSVVCVCVLLDECVYIIKWTLLFLFFVVGVVSVIRFRCLRSHSASHINFSFEAQQPHDETKRNGKQKPHTHTHTITLIWVVFRWMINMFGLIAYVYHCSSNAQVYVRNCDCVNEWHDFNWINLNICLSVYAFYFSLGQK